MTIFERAAGFVANGDVVGLGSGKASTAFIKALGQRVKTEGLKIKGVPTSNASDELARQLGIPIVGLDEGMPLALTVDGADEVAPDLGLIKGYGRALVREKIVAAASKRLVILAGKDKRVKALGERGKLPVEVVPLAKSLCEVKLRELGLEPMLWWDGGKPGLTDNGNYILDCKTGPLADAAGLEPRILAIPGVLGTGLFLGMASLVLIGDQQNNFEFVEELTPAGRKA
jgi:ribose 5-phosphate isomerase A